MAKRWKVEVHAKLDAVLMLSSVNLPGGELRRRSEEDERLMRDYLKEGDLISAEVQNVMSDGSLSLHTRSLKYGKLGQGVLLQVSHFPVLGGDWAVKKQKLCFKLCLSLMSFLCTIHLKRLIVVKKKKKKNAVICDKNDVIG